MNTETKQHLIEPSLFYDPPYERPLEDEFAWHLIKYLRPITGLSYQVKAETPLGNEWVDFVVEHDGNRYGFEIGLHDDTNDYTGRDALVIGSQAVDVLYRFEATALLYRPHDALYLVSRWDPALFSERGRANLQVLASPEARRIKVHPHEAEASILYQGGCADVLGDMWDGDPPSSLTVTRLSRANPGGWLCDYDEALSQNA